MLSQAERIKIREAKKKKKKKKKNIMRNGHRILHGSRVLICGDITCLLTYLLWNLILLVRCV